MLKGHSFFIFAFLVYFFLDFGTYSEVYSLLHSFLSLLFVQLGVWSFLLLLQIVTKFGWVVIEFGMGGH